MRIHTEWSNRPATFVIDGQGIIRYARRANAFGDRPTPDKILGQLGKLDQSPQTFQRPGAPTWRRSRRGMLPDRKRFATLASRFRQGLYS